MLTDVLEKGRSLTDAALDRLIPLETQHPVSIHKAMRHSVFAGGKRLRPVLCIEAGRMVAGSLPEGIEELGAALEMLHTYSLIHDDLPALDNDDLRRGRPTCHKVFGEAIAILAGDALQTQAYEVLARLNCPAEARVRIVEEIARETGTVDGMIGGQVVDLEAEHTRPDTSAAPILRRLASAARPQPESRWLRRTPYDRWACPVADRHCPAPEDRRLRNNSARPPARTRQRRRPLILLCLVLTNLCVRPTF